MSAYLAEVVSVHVDEVVRPGLGVVAKVVPQEIVENGLEGKEFDKKNLFNST